MGWRMPPGAVYVGRPTRWGNPFRPGHADQALSGDGWVVKSIGIAGTEGRAEAVAAFRDWIATVDIDFSELRGRDLACWCALDQPCHADVLLELANR
jgi:hypothetical protein